MDCLSTWVQVENVLVLNYSPIGMALEINGEGKSSQ